MASTRSASSVDSGFSRAIISVQIVHVDYYLCRLRDMSNDRQFHSSLQKSTGLGSTQVPVVRIFGATPAGQKTCVHLHGALPHFFVPLPRTVRTEDTTDFSTRLQAELEKGLQASLRGSVDDAKDPADDDAEPPQRQRFIYSIQPVRRRGIYGYDQSLRTFLKISVFNPMFIPRLAAMCASGLLQVSGGELQPYESHIPFTLQVMVDLNLVGMGFLNLAGCRFRLPLPEGGNDPTAAYSAHASQRLFLRGIEESHPQLFWGFSVLRWSTSALELDAFVDDVLNKESLQELDADSGGSLTDRAVHTLRVLWEEEKLRRNGSVPEPVEAPRSVLPGAHLSDSRNVVVLNQLLRDSASGQGDVPEEQSTGPEEVAAASHPARSTALTQDTAALEAEIAAELLRETYAGTEIAEQEITGADGDDALLDWLDRNAEEQQINEITAAPAAAEQAPDSVLYDLEGEDDVDCGEQWDDILECSQQVENVQDEETIEEENLSVPQLDGAKDDSSGSEQRAKLLKKRRRAASVYPPLGVSSAQERRTVSKRARKGKSDVPPDEPLNDTIQDSTRVKWRRPRVAQYVPLLFDTTAQQHEGAGTSKGKVAPKIEGNAAQMDHAEEANPSKSGRKSANSHASRPNKGQPSTRRSRRPRAARSVVRQLVNTVSDPPTTFEIPPSAERDHELNEDGDAPELIESEHSPELGPRRIVFSPRVIRGGSARGEPSANDDFHERRSHQLDDGVAGIDVSEVNAVHSAEGGAELEVNLDKLSGSTLPEEHASRSEPLPEQGGAYENAAIQLKHLGEGVVPGSRAQRSLSARQSFESGETLREPPSQSGSTLIILDDDSRETVLSGGAREAQFELNNVETEGATVPDLESHVQSTEMTRGTSLAPVHNGKAGPNAVDTGTANVPENHAHSTERTRSTPPAPLDNEKAAPNDVDKEMATVPDPDYHAPSSESTRGTPPGPGNTRKTVPNDIDTEVATAPENHVQTIEVAQGTFPAPENSGKAETKDSAHETHAASTKRLPGTFFAPQKGNRNAAPARPEGQETKPAERTGQLAVPGAKVQSRSHVTTQDMESTRRSSGVSAGAGVASHNKSSHVTTLRPSKRAPTAADLLAGLDKIRMGETVHPLPYYASKQDVPKKPKTYGGVTFRIRHGGTSALDEAPSLVVDEKKRSKAYIARVVRPSRRPPMVHELRTLSTPQSARVLAVRRTKIDSAGREVAYEEHVEQSSSAVGVATQSTNSQQSSGAPHGAKRRSYKVKGYEAASGSEDTENESLQDSDDGIDVGAAQTVPESTVVDGVDVVRPASPKYDENMFFNARQRKSRPSYADSSHISGAERKSSEGKARQVVVRQEGEADMAGAIGQVLRMTLAVMEVLAATRKKLLPDPRYDSVRLVVISVREELGQRERGDSSETDRHLFVCKGDKETARVVSDLSGIPADVHIHMNATELELINEVIDFLVEIDPDALIGFDVQNSSVGYFLDRCAVLGLDFAQAIARMLDLRSSRFKATEPPSAHGAAADESRGGASDEKKVNVAAEYMRRTAGGGFDITGRHVINLWRVVRHEVKLNSYTFENVVSEVLGCRIAYFTPYRLNKWMDHGQAQKMHRSVRYMLLKAQFTFDVISALDMIGRTSEQARVYGIDFMSVLTRGSQYRVESMLIRLSHQRNYVLLAATREQVYKQPAVECLPLVMEPKSAYYTDPVAVLDFQSLYPSMIIAHNLCFSTMLGSVRNAKSWRQRRKMGVRTDYRPPCAEHFGTEGKDDDLASRNVFVSSNGEAFCTAAVRRGILPQLLKEILDTRVMTKKAMKDCGQPGLVRLLNARQFALKMIANVTYGYTSASFSGRMPCAGLADTIVQCARDALERSANLVEERWAHLRARVVYGDTDSLFVLLPGCSRERAHQVGLEIAENISAEFPAPIKLKLEKIYHPCMLVTKKRYVGYAYEEPEQKTPMFDAKGIETVRRDSVDVVRKMLEKSLRTLFETNNLSRVRGYCRRQWKRIISGKASIQDFIFRQEVRLGSYKPGHLPPAAIVATRRMQVDPRAVPKHGERVPYVVVYTIPNAPLRDNVVSPEDALRATDTQMRINATYYITKQIIPTLERHFHLLGVDVASWYSDMPRPPVRPQIGGPSRPGLRTLYGYYASEKCPLCDEIFRGRGICAKCSRQRQSGFYVLAQRLRAAEAAQAKLHAVCMECVRWRDPLDIGCSSIDCPVYLEKSRLSTKTAAQRATLESVESLASEGWNQSIYTPLKRVNPRC